MGTQFISKSGFYRLKKKNKKMYILFWREVLWEIVFEFDRPMK
jgi:hypothetical protein